MARTELPNGVILPAEYSDDWYEDMTSNLTKLDDVIGSDSEKLNADGVYFLRMSSAALTDSGTGNFSDLNSSYKIKTGDLVLDSGRKLYRIVSVDSTNETFTVGNSLFKVTAESDLAPVAESGDYDDLDNKPALKPVATSGDYDDLDNKPDLNPYDQHLANTDIHVTTADKTKWNNGVSQAYVVRYASVAVSDNSTVPYTDLNNVDNIKANDLLLDTNGKLYQISSVDTANETVSVTTPLTQLAVDSDVVHKSGDETVGGIKTFSDYTYIRALNFTNEVASPSSSGSAVMPIVTTVTYTDSSPSQSARLNFRITADGIKSLYPHENNQYALGLQSRKWSEVRAIQYYYGSSDTEFSDKFVTTDTAQTIGQNKTFTGVITINHAKGGIFQLTCPDLDNTIDVTGNWAEFISFNSVDGGQTVASKGAVGLRQFKNGKNFALLLVEGSETLYFGSKSNSDSTKALYPANSGICDLGTSTNKWKTINGLEPSSLSMPDLNNGIDISGYINTGDSDNSYTPLADGYISVRVNSTTSCGLYALQGDVNTSSYGNIVDIDLGGFFCSLFIPVIKNVACRIVCMRAQTIVSAKFFPCQGNV